MSTFVTSDEHYGHNNIIRLSNRPFASVGEMNKAIVDNHNKVVGDSDLTIHLGDFLWSGSFYEYVSKLNGFHIFLKGNHDRNVPKPGKHSIGTCHKYEVLENQIYQLTINGKIMVFCHYPILEWNGYYRGSVHYYGHTHKDLKYDKNAIHAGVDTNNFQPVLIA